jgi:hypothetical protein
LPKYLKRGAGVLGIGATGGLGYQLLTHKWYSNYLWMPSRLQKH